ncbi:MAG TPA: hypothetical protein VKB38_21845 [Terracidiphilus sp.]|nr:hypothetical protein [Terracidiphilus sp.]
MRRSSLLICIFCGLAIVSVKAVGREDRCQDHQAFIERAIQSADSIQPGNSRAKIEQDFVMEGGLQTAAQTRYVLKKCRLIKIDVEFTAADGGKPQFTTDTGEYSPDDVVVKVGRPYLEYPIAD